MSHRSPRAAVANWVHAGVMGGLSVPTDSRQGRAVWVIKFRIWGRACAIASTALHIHEGVWLYEFHVAMGGCGGGEC